MVNVGTNLAGDTRITANVAPSKQGLLTESEVLVRPSKEVGSSEKSIAEEELVQSDYTEVSDAIKNANQKLTVKSTNIIFEFYDKAEPPVVKVVDKNNGEVIREIPSKEFREMTKALDNLADNMNSNTGLLLDEQL